MSERRGERSERYDRPRENRENAEYGERRAASGGRRDYDAPPSREMRHVEDRREATPEREHSRQERGADRMREQPQREREEVPSEPSLGEQIANAMREKPLRPKESNVQNHQQAAVVSNQSPLSLNSLRREPTVMRSDGKVQTPEHKNALKDALSSILKAKQEEEKQERDAQVPEVKEEKTQKNQELGIRNQGAAAASKGPKEIPEDVLRGMLKVEK